jgi:hypothetical protein
MPALTRMFSDFRWLAQPCGQKNVGRLHILERGPNGNRILQVDLNGDHAITLTWVPGQAVDRPIRFSDEQVSQVAPCHAGDANNQCCLFHYESLFQKPHLFRWRPLLNKSRLSMADPVAILST